MNFAINVYCLVKYVRMSDGNGFDFTNRAAKVKYMDALYGPDPPVMDQMLFSVSIFTSGLFRAYNLFGLLNCRPRLLPLEALKGKTRRTSGATSD
jgi:hypothetical protein